MRKIPDDLESKLNKLLATQNSLYKKGNVADYIPALAQVPPELMGVTVATIDGKVFTAGDYDNQFSIQSISKVFGLVMAMNRIGEDLWKRVNMEPSGQPFNSIIQLEWEKGIPRNPVINAGAILVADVLASHYSASKLAFLSFMRSLADDENIYIDQDVNQSELIHGNRNAALAYLMKSFGNIEAEVPDVLAHYFAQCSVSMSCKQLAQSLLFLANKGIQPLSNKKICKPTHPPPITIKSYTFPSTVGDNSMNLSYFFVFLINFKRRIVPIIKKDASIRLVFLKPHASEIMANSPVPITIDHFSIIS